MESMLVDVNDSEHHINGRYGVSYLQFQLKGSIWIGKESSVKHAKNNRGCVWDNIQGSVSQFHGIKHKEWSSPNNPINAMVRNGGAWKILDEKSLICL
ncbi:hypothetical protein FEM48_Zijuj06G0209600 [Ziziphus jujuba var. spinosa]|uniref:Uncharacterized protein n=1 Tax=Ziziphus jujuba var. spinosa TaxID=714518 RepID=A0A978VBK8_ZIZJJ|nr:hypothetical protein FEM48_Zijuj06G0209600 [Ziziphus jujuba var. spinosa]